MGNETIKNLLSKCSGESSNELNIDRLMDEAGQGVKK